MTHPQPRGLKPHDLAIVRCVLPWVGREREPLNRLALPHLVEVVEVGTSTEGVEHALVRAVSNGAELWVPLASCTPTGEQMVVERKPRQSTIGEVAAEAKRRGGQQW